MNLKLGFIGIGTIADAVIRGICTFCDIKTQISISPRNSKIAGKLAQDFSNVTISTSNQDVISVSDYVFIALRRQILADELSALSFSKQHKIISFVPTISRSLLAQYTKQDISQIYRAVPLPFISEGKIITPIFPQNSALQDIFRQTGGTVVAPNEEQFDVFMLGGSMMGIYFKFMAICANWLNEQGLDNEQANFYISKLFNCLSEKALQQKKPNFARLQQEYSTKGGTNEMITNLFEQNNGDVFFTKIFNEVLHIK